MTLEVPFGALTLTSINNTYTGGTTIDADGTLRLGDGGTTGSVSGNITDNGTLLFRHSGTFLEAGAISGSGNVVQSGPGTTVLTASNTYSGGTFLAGGTLEAQIPGAIGSGAVTFLAGAPETLRIAARRCRGIRSSTSQPATRSISPISRPMPGATGASS